MRPLSSGTNDMGGFGIAGVFKDRNPGGVFQGHAGSGYIDKLLATATFPTDTNGIILIACFFKSGSASGRVIRGSGPAFQDDGTITLNADNTLTVTANGDVNFTTAAVCGDGLHTMVFANYRVRGIQRLWLDGQLVGSAASTNQQGFNSSVIECGEVTTGRFSIGYIGHAAGWNDQAWASALSANPWQIFAPMRRFLPGAAAPTGVPTLSGLTFIDITATSARPRVTLTF